MEGARTGLSAVVVAVLFALSCFATPLVRNIPDLAAAAPLILIGAFMMEPCRSITWNNLREGIPSFVTVLVVPYWTHRGILAGILVDLLLGWLCRIFQPACDVASGAPMETRPYAASPGKRPATPHSVV